MTEDIMGYAEGSLPTNVVSIPTGRRVLERHGYMLAAEFVSRPLKEEVLALWCGIARAICGMSLSEIFVEHKKRDLEAGGHSLESRAVLGNNPIMFLYSIGRLRLFRLSQFFYDHIFALGKPYTFQTVAQPKSQDAADLLVSFAIFLRLKQNLKEQFETQVRTAESFISRCKSLAREMSLLCSDIEVAKKQKSAYENTLLSAKEARDAAAQHLALAKEKHEAQRAETAKAQFAAASAADAVAELAARERKIEENIAELSQDVVTDISEITKLHSSTVAAYKDVAATHEKVKGQGTAIKQYAQDCSHFKNHFSAVIQQLQSSYGTAYRELVDSTEAVEAANAVCDEDAFALTTLEEHIGMVGADIESLVSLRKRVRVDLNSFSNKLQILEGATEDVMLNLSIQRASRISRMERFTSANAAAVFQKDIQEADRKLALLKHVVDQTNVATDAVNKVQRDLVERLRLPYPRNTRRTLSHIPPSTHS